MNHYCLLCDKDINHFPYYQHNFHRYSAKQNWIEFFKTDAYSEYAIRKDLIFSIGPEIVMGYANNSLIVNEKELKLFKGLYKWDLAKTLVDKIKVFK